MEERNRKTELLVGMFLTFGLLLLGGLILKFSSISELFKGTYLLTAPFSDGTGIRVDTPVRLGGLKIGKVQKKPEPNSTYDGVIITLEVYEDVQIPTDAKLAIATAGLLGDSFIDVRPSGKAPTAFFQPGAVLTKDNIVTSGGLGALQDQATVIGKNVDAAVADIRDAVADLRLSLKRINEGALSEQSSADIKGTVSHLNSVVKRLDEVTFGEDTSKDLKEAVQSFKNAAKTMEDSMKKLDPAVTKIESVVANADKVMVSANGAMKSLDESAVAIGKVAKDLTRGDGLLPALIHDGKLRSEFSLLITNMRQRGILFYKDKAGQEAQPETQVPLRRPRAPTNTRR